MNQSIEMHPAPVSRREARNAYFDNWLKRDAIPFDEFMSVALYHDQFGYYTTGIKNIGGPRGDFATSVTVSNKLGSSIAQWLIDENKNIKSRSPFWHCVEVGAGDGSLAKSILDSLPPRWRTSCRYHIVEKSPVLRSLQQEKLSSYKVLFKSQVKWHDDMDSVLKTTPHFHVVSNELVDAFPVTLLQWKDNSWKKVFLKLEDNGLFESFHDVSRHELSGLTTIAEPLNWPNESPQPNQRCEVHFSYREWLHSWVPRWNSGSMLTIDYGEKFPHIYDKKIKGTLRAYFQHQRVQGQDVYSRFGNQDITCDVNFSDLEHWGAELELNPDPLMSQSEFMHKFCKSNLLEENDSYISDQEKAGNAFKVLVQRKDY